MGEYGAGESEKGTAKSTSMMVSLVLLLLISLTIVIGSRLPSRVISNTQDSSKDSHSWHRYVRAPTSKTVTPKRIVSTSVTGHVSHPEGCVDGDRPTVLSRLNSYDDIPRFIVDFGQNYVGHLNLKLKGRTNSSTQRPGLRLAFSETLEFLTDRSDFTRSDNADSDDKLNKLVYHGTDQVAVKSELYTWTDTFGCELGDKVCSDGLHGFRYVKIWLEALPEDQPHTTSFGQVDIHSVTLTYSGFLGTPATFTGWFECSDETLTQYWYDGVYTNDMCTDIFRETDVEPRQGFTPTLDGKVVLHDGAKRDRDPYVGDLAVSALTAYLSHNIPSAARNVLADLADHQREDGWIPPASIRSYSLPLFDYPLWWVTCSYNHVLHTGDTEYLETYYPRMVKTLDVFYPSVTDNTTGLVTKGLSNTGGYGDYAFLPRSGAVTYYNALYVLALNHAAELATHLKDIKSADRWRERARTVSRSLLERNWDHQAGAFLDGTSCTAGASGLCPTHPQDGNAISILAGVTQQEQSEAILKYLNTSSAKPYGNAFFDNDALSPGFSSRVYPFISYFDIAARFESPVSSTIASGIDQLKRLYGHMANSDPGVTFWEGVGEGGEPYEGSFTNMAHGWSTGVVPLLTQYVLGVKPTGIGHSTWRVKPLKETDGVTWARGVVPTPYGGIKVDWTVKDREFEMSVEGPDETEGEVWVPVDSVADRVIVDGIVEYDGGREKSSRMRYDEAGYVTFRVRGGKHNFVALGASKYTIAWLSHRGRRP